MGKKEEKAKQAALEQQIARIKLPRGRQCFGIVQQRLGGSRMRVICLDEKKRICRIPGRLKRKLWLREGDIVLIEPWEFNNEKGDLIFKFNPSAVQWLKKQGHLKNLQEEF